jgi:sugar-specific transcriptional regulator TrmB
MSSVVQKLRELKLTEYESRVYCALVEGGALTAEEVSKASGVPLTRVYSVLESLQAKNMVVEVAGRPKKFEALQPRIAMKGYVAHMRSIMEEGLRRLEERARELSTVLESIYWSKRLGPSSAEVLRQLASLGEMESYTKLMISTAEREVRILTYLFTWFDAVREELSEALRRGVEVKVLAHELSRTASRKVYEAKSVGVEVRVYAGEPYPIRGTIVDGRRAVFMPYMTVTPERPLLSLPYYSENVAVVRMLRDAFNYLWSSSRDLEARDL